MIFWYYFGKREGKEYFFLFFLKLEDFVFSLEVDCVGLECGYVMVRGD